MITIPCGGRPVKELEPSMIITLQMQRMQMTVQEMADFHKVSRSTMHRWLKKAGCVNGKEKAQS